MVHSLMYHVTCPMCALASKQHLCLCQCTFLYCFCLSLKRPTRICLSAVALLLLFRLRLLKLLHRCTPHRWVCSKRSTLQVHSWGTVSFPSHPKPAHCNVPTIMPSYYHNATSIHFNPLQYIEVNLAGQSTGSSSHSHNQLAKRVHIGALHGFSGCFEPSRLYRFIRLLLLANGHKKPCLAWLCLA